MINTVALFGRLTADAEMRAGSSGIAVAKFDMAVNERKKNNEEVTHYINCTAFGKTAEIVRDYLGKGQPVIIQGRLNHDQWETKNGEKKSKLGVIVENLQLIPKNSGITKPNSKEQQTEKSKGKSFGKKVEPQEDDLESEMPF